uniref:Uncharacterized protein n=1 Tax=Rhodosorus marinus TaxID=101924 RepID=A0A7S3E9E3_9RHOD|mmetsp:Transcript_1856/g.6955  ORF Transcript_1856/g.6955 Transcript_1856/m.6955 type:complete len:304 (+) Transcript_1856:197-1108(+)
MKSFLMEPLRSFSTGISEKLWWGSSEEGERRGLNSGKLKDKRRLVVFLPLAVLVCFAFSANFFIRSSVESSILSGPEIEALQKEARGEALLTQTIEGWEWRAFYPKEKGEKESLGKKKLHVMLDNVLEVAKLIGFKKKKSQLSHDDVETRSDIYIVVPDPGAGLKYRGDGGKEDTLLELKLRTRTVTEYGFFSDRDYVLEDWDKMIRKPLGKSRGRDVVLDILQEAVQEYDARQFGSKEDRFRFNPEVKSLLGLAKESAENESKFKQVRYLNREPHFLVSSATLPEPFCGLKAYKTLVIHRSL